MERKKYERPTVSIIVSEHNVILSDSQRPYGHSKEGGYDIDWNEDEEDGGTIPSLQSFDDEEE